MAAVVLAVLGILVAIFIPVGIERIKRPSLRIEASDDLNHPGNPPSFGPTRFTHVRIINEPIEGRLGKWLLRNPATSCFVDIEFVSQSDRSELTIPGRWSARPQPLFFGNFNLDAVPETLWYDLPADPRGQGVAVAVKAEGDPHAYAFTSESYADPSLRVPRFALPHEAYLVRVTARSGGVEKSASFTLHNEGTATKGLRLTDPQVS